MEFRNHEVFKWIWLYKENHYNFLRTLLSTEIRDKENSSKIFTAYEETSVTRRYKHIR